VPRYKSPALNYLAAKIAEKNLQVAALDFKRAEARQELDALEVALQEQTFSMHVFCEFEIENQTHNAGNREWINRFWYNGKDYFCEAHGALLETEEKARQYLRIVERKMARMVGKEVHPVSNYLDPPYQIPRYPNIGKVVCARVPFAWIERQGKTTFVHYSEGRAWEFDMMRGLFNMPRIPLPNANPFQIRPKVAYDPACPPS
jgi:hypothetical protein